MKRTITCLAVCAAFLAAQAPVNDAPAGALAVFDGINPGAPSGLDGFTYSNAGATTSGFPLCTGTGGLDLWFLYSATNSGPCVFQTCTPAGFANGTLADTDIDVWDDAGGAPGVKLACDDDACNLQGNGSSSVVTVTAGLNYFVRVYNWSGTTVGSFYLSIAPTDAFAATAATGEDCATTVATLPPTLSGIVLGDTTGALSSAPTGVCATILGTDLDLWWSFVAPATGTLFLSRESADASATNAGPDATGALRMALYDGSSSCAALTNLLCSATTNNISAPVAAGNLYFVRTGGTAAAPFTLSFNLLLPPANDDCANATPVVDGTNPATGTYSNVGALDDAGYTAAACAAGAVGSKGVWFTYVAGTTGNVAASTCNQVGFPTATLLDTVVEVFDNCGATFTSIACNDTACTNLSTAVFAAVAGNQYWIRVSSKSTTLTGTFTLTMNPAPVNDECVSAVPLSNGANGPFVHFGATTSAGVPTCSAVNQDLWFTYTATETAVLKLNTCGSNVDTVVAVYDVCAGTQLACDDDDLSNLGPCATTQTLNSYLELPVTLGTTYLIRVGNFSATTFGQYTINLSYKFSLALTYDAPTFTVTIADVAGTPGNLVLNALTLNQGNYPNGYFYGVDIPIFEVFGLLLQGPPFFTTMDVNGRYTFSAAGVPPLGVTFYAVAVEFSLGGLYVQDSEPTSLFF
jgi:hypothetical protein